MGWFAHSALLAHRNGRDFAQEFTDCSHAWLEPGRTVRITLLDAVAQIEVELTLRLDPRNDVLSLSSKLVNRGTESLEVQWLAAGVLPLPAESAQDAITGTA
jgi:alpha-galactosidase